MNEVLKRRIVGASVLAVFVVLFAALFFKRGGEPGLVPDQASDLADVRTYAIDVPAVPEQLPEEILAEGAPIGTLLPVPQDKAPKKDEKAKAERNKPVVKKAAEPATTVSTASPVPDVGWSVQVGSFASRDNADGLQKKLKDKGYPAFVYRNASENPPLFRVRVGPYTKQDEAKLAAQRLREELRLDVRVVANG